ncbi:hypothetical protein [Rhizobium sp. OAE497]|uniref:hypothetical protein n=1 Tax=Rhizobium sp. OAE497 TaxID=2663796 RepID=UPI0018F294AB
MRLVTLPGKILAKANHTLIIMGDGAARQAVCVLDEALKAANRVDAVRQHLGLIERIASGKTDRGEVAFDGRVWITSADLASDHGARLH